MSQELYAIIVMGLTMIGLGWSAKKELKEDASKAHAEIGKNIDLVRQEMHKDFGLVRQDIRELRGDVKELNTRVSRVEGKLGLPSE
jgi:polyhydroxyalkanoate synthesis regulator phasin